MSLVSDDTFSLKFRDEDEDEDEDDNISRQHTTECWCLMIQPFNTIQSASEDFIHLQK